MDGYEVETSYLGSILIEGSLFKDVEINDKYFVYEAHQLIFQAMEQLASEEKAIDVVTVTTELLRKQIIERIGGVSYLSKVADSVPNTATFKHYEQILREAYQLREAKKAVQRFLYQPTEQMIDHLLEDLKECRELTLKTEERSTYVHLIEISEELTEPNQENVGYETNLPAFDRLTGGLQRGDLIILAARPSVGKTAFALNIASGHCKQGGILLCSVWKWEQNNFRNA